MGLLGGVMGYKVGSGIDKLIEDFGNLALESEEISKRALYDGMKVVADAIVSNISGIKTGHGISEADIAGLRSGFGISRMQTKGSSIDAKTGFAGTNANGKKNSTVARGIESGTSYRAKQPFVSKAGRSAKGAAEAAIAKTLEEEINKRMR